MPLTMEDEDGREWTAVGFSAETGELLWVPSDTDIVTFNPVEPAPVDDEPSDDQLANGHGMEGGIAT